MPEIILLNKPFQVLSQFRSSEDRVTLARFIDIPSVYPAGRLDFDSEGLLLLTGNGALQHAISHPRKKLPKTYYVQVDGQISADAVRALREGVTLKDGATRPAEARVVDEPHWLWHREPPVRYRANIPTSWIELTIREGRNRQVRRMTAAVGFPTLRLIRYAIGEWTIDQLQPGQYRRLQVSTPDTENRGAPRNSTARPPRTGTPPRKGKPAHRRTRGR